MSSPAFVTGSYAYGTPTDRSDLDVVVLVEDDETSTLLQQHADTQKGSTPDSLVFGKMNLIIVGSRAWYDCWYDGTQALIARRPVTRDEAKAYLNTLEKERGLSI